MTEELSECSLENNLIMNCLMTKVSEIYKKMPQSHIADQPMAS